MLYLHNLVLQLRQEEIHDLVLLDGQRVKVDLLHALNLSSLDKPAELSDWLPLFLLLVASSSCTSSATSSAAASISSASVAEAASATVTTSSRCVSHGMQSLRGIRWAYEVLRLLLRRRVDVSLAATMSGG